MNILLLLVRISIYLGTLAPLATDIEIKDFSPHGIHQINVWLDILLSQERVAANNNVIQTMSMHAPKMFQRNT